jgi:virulence-associated protein VapD
MSAQNSNENLTIHHRVKNYTTWRKGYDANEQSRLSAGITNGKVFYNPENENDVVVIVDVADVAKARAWFNSTEVKAVMQKSGVLGAPSIRFAA